MGPLATLGGPLLGVAVARWAPFRGSALLGVVVPRGRHRHPGQRPRGSGWRLASAWPVLIDEHVTDGKILSTTIVPDIAAGLGAGLGRLPVRAGRRGRAAPRPGAPPRAARDRWRDSPSVRSAATCSPCHERVGGRAAADVPHRAGVRGPGAARGRRPARMRASRRSSPGSRSSAWPEARRTSSTTRRPSSPPSPRPGWWRRRAPGLVVGRAVLAAAWLGLLLVLALAGLPPSGR